MSHDPSAAGVKTVLDAYLETIGSCDAATIAAVWLNSPQISFIHPRGHERGYDAVLRGFYRETMAAPFSKRALTILGEPGVNLFAPDFAVVEFDWDFVATWRRDGEELHSSGRESHVYGRFPEQGWRLLHVHYSGPAKTGDGQGF